MAGTRILGLDPGLAITGYGLIEAHGDRLLHLGSGEIRAPAKEKLAARLVIIYRELSRIIDCHRPTEAALEQVFLHRNPNTAIKLGQARGAAIVACAGAGLELDEYSANQIKLSTVGRGHADKVQVQYMVQMILSLPKRTSTDASDALATAICHAHHRTAPQLLRGRRR